MNYDTFSKTVSKNRSRQIGNTLVDVHGNTTKEVLKHKPYVECPRCSNWKLAAHVKRTRDKKFLRGYTDWEILKRWWECGECAAVFNVTPPQREEHTDAINEPADDAGERPRREDEDVDDTEEGDPDASTPKTRYELTHVTSVSTDPIPVDGGEKGVVLGTNVRVPVRSAKFRLPRGTDIPRNTEVRIEREGDDVFCVETE